MASPRGARPGNVPPPNYDPNVLANNMQNLQINRPNQAPVSGGVRPPPPFGQQPPPFPGAPAASRPGPPPPGAFPRGVVPASGPQQTASPPNYASNRPAGPPSGAQPPQPYASRPPPRVLSPSMAGGSAVQPPPGTLLSSNFGSRPAAPSMPTPFGSNPVMPPLRTSGPMSNGPPTVGSEQGPPRFPSVGGMPQPSVGGPPQAMYPPFGSPPFGSPPFGSPPAVHSMSQPNQPFSVATQNMQPRSPSHLSAQVPGMRPPPSDSSFGSQPWQMAPRQVGPPSIHGYVQQPRMGIPPPHQSMASIPAAVGHTGAGLAAPTKIDPNQIPRPFPSSAVIQHETHQGNQVNPPPPFMQPSYMRCTINQIPCTADLLNTSAMQLALLVQPLALPHPSEDPIQVVDFGESGPVRCSRCKGYINPFMKFIDQGRRFICNLCGYTDETPRDYHSNLGPDGRRRDVHERPELCQGTVEFVATREYMVRDPMPTVYFFLVDVSMNAVKTGATAAACSAIAQVISDLPEGPRTMVGVATFDSTIHFYNLKRDLQQPLMLIVPDIQDVYTPLESDVIVQLCEYRQHVELLLETIPRMFNNPRTADSAFGAAVKAAFLAMKSTGGKLLVFQSVLPSVGLGALSAREAEGRTNISTGEKEAHKLLQPADKTLKALALEFAEYQVCVDVFFTTQTYVDIASISVIPRTTGGRVYYYYPFSALSDNAKLYNDLRWNVTRPQGFEAVMRVRCSQGLQVQEYHGNFCKRIPTDVDLPAIDCDKTIMVTLKHDDKLQDGSECSFQCALLYTTMYGERRIRVSTLSLPCTTNLSNLFRAADLDTQFACMLKQAASDTLSLPLLQVREHATNFCINILSSYRKFCATVTSSGQLILPEALKLLPLYTLAMVKSTGLRTDGRVDDRSYWINYVSPLCTSLAIPLVYPRLISIHDLESKESESSIPECLPLSSEHVSDDGIYLLENGEDCLIYIGSSANPTIIQQLLGISSVQEMPEQFVLQPSDNPLSKKLNDIINEIRSQRCSFLRLRLCKKGEPSGMAFFSYFVEDKTPLGLSYVEFLVHVHRQIQNKMQ